MKINITARQFTASDQLKDFTETTVGKLSRFFDRITEVEVIYAPFEDENKPQSVELIARVPNDVLVVKEHDATYEQALKAAVDVMKRQVKKYKETKVAK